MSRTLQFLLLLLLGGLVWADASVHPYKNVTDGPHSCGGIDIPYPFGVIDGDKNSDFREGFGVQCNGGKPVLPTTGNGEPLLIGNFAIETAEARVWLPVGWQCYNSSGWNGSSEYMNLQFNNKGVYRISNAKNELFVLGCNTLGYLESNPDANNYYTQRTGCACYCDNSGSAMSGACSGVGCCHVDIPPDLVDNYVYFEQSNTFNHSKVLDFSPCDYAFVAEKDNYIFNTSDLNKDLSRTPWLMPVMLDWAIRDNNITCKEAKKKKDYACKSSHSLCLNATNGPGYICRCRKGYEGNPYTDNGCTDINECERLGQHYKCKGVCKNKQGYYECTCPKNTRSADPYNEACSPDIITKAKIIAGTYY